MPSVWAFHQWILKTGSVLFLVSSLRSKSVMKADFSGFGYVDVEGTNLYFCSLLYYWSINSY